MDPLRKPRKPHVRAKYMPKGRRNLGRPITCNSGRRSLRLILVKEEVEEVQCNSVVFYYSEPKRWSFYEKYRLKILSFVYIWIRFHQLFETCRFDHHQSSSVMLLVLSISLQYCTQQRRPKKIYGLSSLHSLLITAMK